MSRLAINFSYLQSLIWTALFLALIRSEAEITRMLFRVHVNPHQTGSLIALMKVVVPAYGIFTFVATFFILTLPQYLQAEIVGASHRAFGDRPWFAALLAWPVTAVLTWYCYRYVYDYLNVCFGGCVDAEPDDDGLSVLRYFKSLLFQAPITLFSFLYFIAGLRGNSRKPIILGALAATLVAGAIWGYLKTTE
jgi:hypothetical protein